MNIQIANEIDVLTFISGSLSTIGAFFLVRGVITSSAHHLSKLSGTYIGSNPHLAQSLAEQKADTLFGFALVLVSGVFWIACAVMKLSINATPLAYLLFAVIDTVLFLLCFFFAGKYRSAFSLETKLINFVYHLGSALGYPELFDEKVLLQQAKEAGLETYFDGATDPFECLKKCAVAGGASPGAELIEKLRLSRQRPT
jgi:hypothetical protein